MSTERHLRLALALLALFLASGIWLEAMYGLRATGFMQDPLRREFLRLGHAHGGLLSLLNVAVAWSITTLRTPKGWARLIRPATLAGAALVGLGFMGGGIWHGPTDPGPLVLLVPAGALSILASLVALVVLRHNDRDPLPGSADEP